MKNGCSVRLDIIILPVQKNDVGHVQFGKVEAMVARPIPGLSIFRFLQWWTFKWQGGEWHDYESAG